MNAHLQRIERQRAIKRHHKLAIDDEGLRLECAKHGHHFGKITRQGLARFCPEIDLVAGAESETTKTIPFRLELPAWLRGKLADELRLHGLGADRHGKALQQRNGHTLVFTLVVVLTWGGRLTIVEILDCVAILDKEHRSQFRVGFDRQARRRLRMDTTTLIIIILVLILLLGGGWYGRGRWY
jgi:hypothetical protein